MNAIILCWLGIHVQLMDLKLYTYIQLCIDTQSCNKQTTTTNYWSNTFFNRNIL